jgi:hypothetical protein
LRPYGDRRTLLSYEARTHATDEAARRGFLRYWRVVSPGVGIVLRGTLVYIAGLAEGAGAAGGGGGFHDSAPASPTPRNVSP